MNCVHCNQSCPPAANEKAFSRRHYTAAAHLAAKARKEASGTGRCDPPKGVSTWVKVGKRKLPNGKFKSVYKPKGA